MLLAELRSERTQARYAVGFITHDISGKEGRGQVTLSQAHPCGSGITILNASHAEQKISFSVFQSQLSHRLQLVLHGSRCTQPHSPNKPSKA